MAPPKRKMRREAKIILAVIPLLLAGIGVAVYLNVQSGGFAKQIVEEVEDEIDKVEEKVKENFASHRDERREAKAALEEVRLDEEVRVEKAAAEEADPFGDEPAERTAQNARGAMDAQTDANAEPPVSLAATDESAAELVREEAVREEAAAATDATFEPIAENPAATRERELGREVAQESERLQEVERLEEVDASVRLEAVQDAKPLVAAEVVELEEQGKLDGHRRVPEFSEQARSETRVVSPEERIVVEERQPARTTIVGEIAATAKAAEHEIAAAAKAAEKKVERIVEDVVNPRPEPVRDPRFGGYRREEMASDFARSSTRIEIREERRAGPGSRRVPGSAPARIELDEVDSERDGRNSPKPTRAETFGSARSTRESRRMAETAIQSLDMAEGESVAERAGGSEVYVIQPNDNYWKISRKVYGTGRYYLALSQHNQAVAPDPKHLRPGLKVKIPPREVLERHYGELLKSSAPSRLVSYQTPDGVVVDAQPSPGLFLGESGEALYRVGSEDTLTGIAKQCLGRSSRWTEIYRLNRESLASPDNLKIGTVLRLPRDAGQNRVARDPSEFR